VPCRARLRCEAVGPPAGQVRANRGTVAWGGGNATDGSTRERRVNVPVGVRNSMSGCTLVERPAEAKSCVAEPLAAVRDIPDDSPLRELNPHIVRNDPGSGRRPRSEMGGFIGTELPSRVADDAGARMRRCPPSPAEPVDHGYIQSRMSRGFTLTTAWPDATRQPPLERCPRVPHPQSRACAPGVRATSSTGRAVPPVRAPGAIARGSCP